MNALELRSADGTKLKAYRWEPEGTSKADVVLVHGGMEHLGRYTYVGEYLAGRGYRVIGVDLRGHGHSEGKRGHVDRWNQYVEDVRAAIATLEGNYFMVCHSMGGLITLDHLRTASSVRGVIASAPLLGLAIQAPAVKTMAAKLLSKLVPALSMHNELDGALVCTDQEVVDRYNADPLVFSTITPRWYTEMLAALERVHRFAEKFRTPLYLCYGTEDAIVDTDAIEIFSKQYGGPVEIKAWPGLFHEIFNEPNKEEVLETACDWLDALANPASTGDERNE